MSVKSRSQESIPSTWSGGMQLISRALTPISSKRRAARPNRSPSGPPQCWPKTPQRPWRQRRKLSQTGSPVASAVSTAAKVASRISDIVSSRSRSGGSSSKARVSSSRRLEPLGAVDVAVEAERDRAVVRAPELGGRPGGRAGRRGGPAPSSRPAASRPARARRSSPPGCPRCSSRSRRSRSPRSARCTRVTARGALSSAHVPQRASSRWSAPGISSSPSSVAIPPSRITHWSRARSCSTQL